MWGNILIETNYHINFNTQFPNTKTDVLIHLAQWQYWWWFWFSFLWVMYYLFLARTLRYRTLKFKPKIVSSFRPHGKWGDLIICLIPVSWCANILINSNFLLKLLEWQAESSLFTVRIRGKQWYWVYKFDFKNFTEILSTPKNVGNNKWVFSFFGEIKNSDNFLHLLSIRSQNKIIKKYWIKNLNKFDQEDKTSLSLVKEFLYLDYKHNNVGIDINKVENNLLESNTILNSDIMDLDADQVKANKINIALLKEMSNELNTNGVTNQLKINSIQNDLDTNAAVLGEIQKMKIKIKDAQPYLPLKKELNFIYKYKTSKSLNCRDLYYMGDNKKALIKESWNRNHKIKLTGKINSFYKSYPQFYNTISSKNKYLHDKYLFGVFSGKKFNEAFARFTANIDMTRPGITWFPSYDNIFYLPFSLTRQKKKISIIFNDINKYNGLINFNSNNFDFKRSYYCDLTNSFLFKNMEYPIINNLNNIVSSFKKTIVSTDLEFQNNKNKILSSKYFLNTDNSNITDFNFLNFSSHEESSKDIKLSLGKTTPVTLLKVPVSKYSVYNNIFKFRYNDLNSNLNQRTVTKTPYFAFKQVRYKRRKLIPSITKQFSDIDLLNKTVKGNFYLKNQYSIETDNKDLSTQYRMFRKNRIRNEKLNVVVSKRLLRVKKTLVLPTHVNITAITNSYDVVHSWFIPGLGLKMDCVPGRSTHHTLYIDNSGFYYGQCAEICGRYHHHMPIRVCALPFEHFLIWWHTFGLPKLMYPGKDYKMLKSYSFRKFVW